MRYKESDSPLSTSEIDKIFLDAASPGIATEGVQQFLVFFEKEAEIRGQNGDFKGTD